MVASAAHGPDDRKDEGFRLTLVRCGDAYGTHARGAEETRVDGGDQRVRRRPRRLGGHVGKAAATLAPQRSYLLGVELRPRPYERPDVEIRKRRRARTDFLRDGVRQ